MPRSISGGGLELPCKCQVRFLTLNDAMHRWPVVIATQVVVKTGATLLAILLECTRCACVIVITWMVAVGPTVATYAL